MTNDQAERLIAAVERLAAATEALVAGQQRKTSTPAKFIKPIEEFANFDWGSIGAKIEYRDIQTPELCENAYRGKVQILTAAGQHWGDAIASWIDSVQGVPVARH